MNEHDFKAANETAVGLNSLETFSGMVGSVIINTRRW